MSTSLYALYKQIMCLVQHMQSRLGNGHLSLAWCNADHQKINVLLWIKPWGVEILLKNWFSESNFKKSNKLVFFPIINSMIYCIMSLGCWLRKLQKVMPEGPHSIKKKQELISMYVQFIIWCLLGPNHFISCSSQELCIRKRFSELCF